MLAKLGTKEDLKIKNFVYETKLDGTRGILYKNNSTIKIINRRNNDITHRYPEFNFEKNIKASSCVLDGEIVIFDKTGISRFNLLQHRDLLEDKDLIEKRSKSSPATYVAFDILELEEKKLTQLSQKERFQILKSILNVNVNKKKISSELGRVGANSRKMGANNNEEIFNKNLKLVTSSKNGKLLFDKIAKKGGEGVIAKNPLERYYEGKRRNAWIKIKNTNSIDAIIIGYTQEKRKLSTLLLAVYENKKLIYIGKVGTGFSEIEQEEILSKLEKIKTEKPEIQSLPKGTIFVKPKLVCEAKFLEITKDKMMRAPVFLRMREDKKPKDCTLKEQI